MPDRARELLARAGLAGLSDRAILVLCAATVVVIAVAAWRFWPSPGGVDVAAAPVDGGVEQAIIAEATAAAEASVTVHVVGAVKTPGVYSLPPGSRVSDAIAAAGGVAGNAAEEGINLARVLADGEQVRMLTQQEYEAGGVDGAGATAASGGGGSASAGGKVDLNRATAAELDALPGVGPSTAQKIVDDREANGPFKKVEDLMRVSGIGQKKFDTLKDLITVN
ncbi:MAG: ComEA family DNA-binding protein [Actinobacteria bacterium]|nr:MAG: ComEA family DNA-binding protein [Actinomycetota bacterium]